MLTLLFGSTLPVSVFACINSYTMELSPDHFDSAQQRIDYYQNELKAFQAKHVKPYSVQVRNDYAVLLILTGQYQQAIEVLESLERSNPNLPKTAVNLGTAYELKGDLTQARKWIHIGMQRDPNIHEGSEWIHLNILNAKRNRANVHWLNQHPLLNLTFGQGYFPKPNHIDQDQITQQQLQSIFDQTQLQLIERKKFVFGHDPIVARVYYDLANIEQSLGLDNWVNRMSYNIEANELIDFSSALGLQKDATIEKRIRMLSSTSLARMWMQIQDYLTGWLAKDK
ncbi:tetratricopeptide repeat protein [Acinetobacter sp. 187]|uniref:tetratricopeptide repeat protein n=1 Tax=Acinetobacter lanii TaxID=2715163 RepID=UPI00140C7804|nr:tetratricopeptide repeat protein [Acinetobacter lanii]NHC02884.1 tetratricopeptide repeat protein [Acinetobacter lanii]